MVVGKAHGSSHSMTEIEPARINTCRPGYGYGTVPVASTMVGFAWKKNGAPIRKGKGVEREKASGLLFEVFAAGSDKAVKRTREN